MTTVTTTITEKQAICMLFCVEFTNENVEKCKKELASRRVVIGYSKLHGDQLPLMLFPEQLLRSTNFCCYVKEEEQEQVEEKFLEETKKRNPGKRTDS